MYYCRLSCEKVHTAFSGYFNAQYTWLTIQSIFYIACVDSVSCAGTLQQGGNILTRKCNRDTLSLYALHSTLYALRSTITQFVLQHSKKVLKVDIYSLFCRRFTYLALNNCVPLVGKFIFKLSNRYYRN